MYIHSIRKDLNRALQSMAERDLLQYAQSNITINVNGAAAKAEDDYSVRDQKEKEEQEDGGETQKEKRIARMIRGFQRNNTENANLKDAVNNMNKEI